MKELFKFFFAIIAACTMHTTSAEEPTAPAKEWMNRHNGTCGQLHRVPTMEELCLNKPEMRPYGNVLASSHEGVRRLKGRMVRDNT